MAATIGNVEAVRIAVNHNAVIQFDETAMSPYFRYINNGMEHEVWFEDVRSVLAKFNLIKEYGLLRRRLLADHALVESQLAFIK